MPVGVLMSSKEDGARRVLVEDRSRVCCWVEVEVTCRL